MLQLLPILCHYREDKELLDDVILKTTGLASNCGFLFLTGGTLGNVEEFLLILNSWLSNLVLIVILIIIIIMIIITKFKCEYHDFVQCWELTRLPKWTEAF